MTDTNEKLKQIQLTQLEMLLYLKSICETHDLNYCLAYGTMLGAVRHKGFIPWDDDLDIAMPYKDAKRLKKYICSEDYFLQTEYSDKNMPFIFYKLRKNNTKMVEPHLAEIDMHHGIWIDIFMYVSAARTKIGKKLQYKLRRLLLALRTKQYKKTYKINRGIYFFVVHMPNVISRVIQRLILLSINLIGSKKSGEYFIFNNNILEHSFISKEYFDNTNDYQFEQQLVRGVNDYDGYLSLNFGDDYMTPKVCPSHTHFDEVVV